MRRTLAETVLAQEQERKMYRRTGDSSSTLGLMNEQVAEEAEHWSFLG